MKLLIVTTLCALMALPVSAQSNVTSYHRAEYESSMTYRQVDDVVNLLNSTSFDDNKLKVAMVCLELHPANTQCIRQMARCFSFSDAKKKFLYFAIDYCTDVRDYYYLRDVLSFSSDKDEFSNFVDDYLRGHSRIENGRR